MLIYNIIMNVANILLTKPLFALGDTDPSCGSVCGSSHLTLIITIHLSKYTYQSHG